MPEEPDIYADHARASSAGRAPRPEVDCPRCCCTRDVMSTCELAPGVTTFVADYGHAFQVDHRGPLGPVVWWDETYVMRPGETPSVPLRNA